MVNTSVMIDFPSEITAAERELILQSGKEDKTSLNFYLTTDAVAIIESARQIFGAKDRTKALEIILRQYREHFLKKRK